MRAFLGLEVWRWVVGNVFLFKMSFGWNFSDNPCESYTLVNFSWLFQLSKNRNFCILMIFEPSFENNDQALIKWCLWLQNWMLTKIWTFDCQMTILPLQLTVMQLGFWLCNFVLKVLKLGMRMLDHIYRHVGLDWTLGNFIFFVRSEEHTSELQSRQYLVCRLLLEKTTIDYLP